MWRRGFGVAVQILLVLAIGALVAGQVLGQPILLGYVETGSMEPTLAPGDGFVAIPSAVAGDVSEGDVVVFDAEEIESGGLTTHRVVDETERGYVTRGDANPFPDQDGGEPPVQDGQIVAVALQAGGDVVAIPRLGAAVTAIGGALERVQVRLATALGIRSLHGSTGLAYLLLGLSSVAYAVETGRERREPDRESRLGRDEDEVPVRYLCLAFAVVVVIAATAAMVVPAGTQSFEVVSAEFESDDPLVIEAGTTGEVPYAVANGGLVPVVSYVQPASDGVAVDRDRVSVGARDEATVSVELAAPDETGYYPAYVTEYRYLHVVPGFVIDPLFDVHPWLPYVPVLAVLGGGTYGLGRALAGADARRRRRRRDRDRRSRLPLRRSYRRDDRTTHSPREEYR